MKKLAIVLCLTLSLLLAACGKEEPEALGPLQVSVMQAERGDLAISSRFVGTVSAADEVSIMPMVSAEVEDVRVKVGDVVTEGQILAQLDDEAAELSLGNAQIALKNAELSASQALGSTWDLQMLNTDSGIRQLQDTIAQYEDMLEEAEEQLEDLEDEEDDLDDAMDDAEDAYADAVAAYNTALAYKAQVGPSLDVLGVSTTGQLYTGAMTEFAALQATGYQGTMEDYLKTASAADLATKPHLMYYKTLNDAGLTVESLTDANIQLLKNQADMMTSMFSGTSSGSASISSGKASLEAAIDQYETAIKTYREQLNTALAARDITNNQVKSETQATLDNGLAAARLGVSSARMQMGFYTLTAPIAGTVTAVSIEPHDFASPGYPVFTISAVDAMTVTFSVSESVRATLAPGEAVTVERSGQTFSGAITEIGNSVDAMTGLFKVKAIVSATGEQLPGGVTATITADTYTSYDALILPYDAVYWDENQAYVYLAKDGFAVKTPVVTDVYNETEIAVISGITEDDSVIVTWSPRLRDGAEIVIGE